MSAREVLIIGRGVTCILAIILAGLGTQAVEKGDTKAAAKYGFGVATLLALALITA